MADEGSFPVVVLLLLAHRAGPPPPPPPPPCLLPPPALPLSPVLSCCATPRSWLFNSELYVDTGALQRLRALYENGSQQRGCISGGSASSSGQPKACLVYIPAHKSHVDYLLLR